VGYWAKAKRVHQNKKKFNKNGLKANIIVVLFVFVDLMSSTWSSMEAI
jgi:hypothetical protein